MTNQTPQSYLPILPEVIDNTMMVCRRSCDRKFYFEHVLGLRGGRTSQDLVAGAAVADAMQAIRHALYAPPRKDLNLALQDGFRAFATSWGDFTPTDDRNPKTLDRTWTAVQDFFSHYPPGHDAVQPYIQSDGTPALEFSFAIPLEDFPPHPVTGNPFIYAGRFDMLGMFNGRLAVVDEKTTKYMGAQWADQWNLRSQFMGYVWACQQLGYDCDTAVVNGIAIQKQAIKFSRASISFPDWLIEEWYEVLYHDVCSIVSTWNTMEEHDVRQADGTPASHAIWTPNFGESCTSYGICQYATLCRAKDPTPWYKQWEVNRWHPLGVGAQTTLPVGHAGPKVHEEGGSA